MLDKAQVSKATIHSQEIGKVFSQETDISQNIHPICGDAIVSPSQIRWRRGMDHFVSKHFRFCSNGFQQCRRSVRSLFALFRHYTFPHPEKWITFERRSLDGSWGSLWRRSEYEPWVVAPFESKVLTSFPKQLFATHYHHSNSYSECRPALRQSQLFCSWLRLPPDFGFQSCPISRSEHPRSEVILPPGMLPEKQNLLNSH